VVLLQNEETRPVLKVSLDHFSSSLEAWFKRSKRITIVGQGYARLKKGIKKISHRNVCSSVLSFRQFQSHIAHNHETLRLRIRRHHFWTIDPLLERPALFEISQLPLPNLAHEKHAAVAAAEVFVAARGDRVLTGLRDFIFEHDEVDAIRIDIVEPKFPGKDGPD